MVDHERLRDASYVGEPFADSFATLLDAVEADMRSYDSAQSL